MHRRNQHIIFIILFMALMTTHVMAQGKKKPDQEKQPRQKKLQINWEKAEGAPAYQVQIMDEKGKAALDQVTNTNSMEFILPPGEYKLRIGTINKFRKVAAWTDWTPISIKKAPPNEESWDTMPTPEPEEEQMADGTKKEKSKKKPIRLPYYQLRLVKIGVGWGYSYLFGGWSDIFQNSYMNGTLNIGIYWGKIGKLGTYSFFRYFGTEIDFSYFQFDGVPNDVLSTNQKKISLLLNLYMRTNFKFIINLIVRGGFGITYTIQHIKSVNPLLFPEGDLISFDLSYKVGATVEIRPARLFYIELGADFNSTLYQGKSWTEIRPIIIAGFTF